MSIAAIQSLAHEMLLEPRRLWLCVHIQQFSCGYRYTEIGIFASTRLIHCLKIVVKVDDHRSMIFALGGERLIQSCIYFPSYCRGCRLHLILEVISSAQDFAYSRIQAFLETPRKAGMHLQARSECDHLIVQAISKVVGAE
jgi:hypothetical protein